MEQRQTISQIAQCVISEMERMQYSPQTISTFRVKAKQLSCYAQEKTGADYFTEELGWRYLADTIGSPFAENHRLTSPESAHIRCVRRIGEYQLYGAVLRNCAKKSKILGGWELGDKEIITAYVESAQTADNSEATKKLRVYHIRQFYEFLASRKISGIYDISARIISDYAASLQGESSVYTKHRLATLRFYFRFLRQNGILEYDWSYAVPKVIAPKNRNVPALWETISRCCCSCSRSTRGPRSTLPTSRAGWTSPRSDTENAICVSPRMICSIPSISLRQCWNTARSGWGGPLGFI